MLNVAVMVVLLAIGAAIATFAGYGVARHRAQNAADLAALAAAGAEAQTGAARGSGTLASAAVDPGVAPGAARPPSAVCAAAGKVASANSASVVRCDLVGSPSDFVVTVRVQVAVSRHPPGFPVAVTAEANAAPVR